MRQTTAGQAIVEVGHGAKRDATRCDPSTLASIYGGGDPVLIETQDVTDTNSAFIKITVSQMESYRIWTGRGILGLGWTD